MPEALAVHRPADGPARQLVLLFHGVGSDPQAMVPLGLRLAAEWPHAAILSVPAAFPCDLGKGYQWFSVRGVSDANRADRVAAALPFFLAAVRQAQHTAGLGPDATLLVGFSQGAILSLESARAGHRLAARIVALGGRFADLPAAVPPGIAFHLLHGADDAVIAVRDCEAAAQALGALGAEVTADVLPATGHTITQAMQDLLVGRLRPGMAASA